MSAHTDRIEAIQKRARRLKGQPDSAAWTDEAAQRDDSCEYCGYPFNTGESVYVDDRGRVACSTRCANRLTESDLGPNTWATQEQRRNREGNAGIRDRERGIPTGPPIKATLGEPRPAGGEML